MSRILVLEDHALLRRAMAQALSRLPEADVTAVGTLRGAKDAVTASPPDLVVADLDLPDGSGLELMGQIREDTDVSVIFVSGYLAKYRTQLRELGGVTIREKPLPLPDLQRLAYDRVNNGLAREKPPFSAADYVQLACMGQYSVVIEVDAPDYGGSIVVLKGRLWAAMAGSLRGDDALKKLTFGRDATVHCSTPRGNPASRNLPDAPWEHLLLSAARQHDETERRPARAAAHGAEVFDLYDCLDDQARRGAAPKIQPPRVASAPGFEVEVERGAEALLRKDYRVALRAYERAHRLRPTDTMVAANVTRLCELVDGEHLEPQQ